MIKNVKHLFNSLKIPTFARQNIEPSFLGKKIYQVIIKGCKNLLF